LNAFAESAVSGGALVSCIESPYPRSALRPRPGGAS